MITIYNCEEVPEAFKLQNNTQEALWSLRTYAEAKVEVLAEYAHIEGRERQQQVANILNLLVKCHSILKLRETTFHAACHLMHKLIQESAIEDSRMTPKVICALLFLLQKYEPTNNCLYKCEHIIRKLFGAASQVTREEIIDCEELVLEKLDHRLETVTPYSFVQFWAEVAGFQSEVQFHLASYLVSIAAVEPSF